MASTPFLMGVLFGFVPAMGLLYIVLHRYQAFFQEKRLFRTFFVGLVAGAATNIVEVGLAPQLTAVANPQVSLDLRLAAILLTYAGLLALLEAFVMAAVLNWRTFRGRRDTPYYGVSFGLGFGAMQVIFLMTGALTAFERNTANVQWSDLAPILALGVYFVGGILVASAQGGWIGRGTSRGPLRPDLVRAVGARGLYVLVLYAILVSPAAWVGYVLALAAVSFGAWLVLRATVPLLDGVVPPEVLREMELHSRRLARRVLREDETPP